MDKWLPIESAPTDPVKDDGKNFYGPNVLLTDGNSVWVGKFWFIKAGASNWLSDGGWACFATHWMPLPEPPKEDGE